MPTLTGKPRNMRATRSAFVDTRNRSKISGREIPILDLFAMACAAQRINGRYEKESGVTYPTGNPYLDDGSLAPVVHHTSNKSMMREWIAKQDMSAVIEQDFNDATAVIGYWKLKLFNVLAGTAKDYEKSAVDCASKDTVSSHDHFSIGLVASLPASYEKGMVRDKRLEERQSAEDVSRHFGQVGDNVSGRLSVIDCFYSNNWLCYYVTAVLDGNVVMFSFKKELKIGESFLLKGRIKKHRDGNITQLNYVKIE